MHEADLVSRPTPSAADFDEFVELVKAHNETANQMKTGEKNVTLRAPKPPPSRKLVLVVDDDRDLCQMIRESLERNGYEAHVEHNGAETISWMQKEYLLSDFISSTPRVPALILVSWELPMRDGFKFVGSLMASTRVEYRGIEIVILSSHESDAPGVLHLDADDFDEEKLLTMVRSRVESTT